MRYLHWASSCPAAMPTEPWGLGLSVNKSVSTGGSGADRFGTESSVSDVLMHQYFVRYKSTGGADVTVRRRPMCRQVCLFVRLIDG